MYPLPVGDKPMKIPRIDYCMTCDHQLGVDLDDDMQPKSNIGPVNHLADFPDHVVISVQGELAIWRKTRP
jgi:hypothetical protein